jgi:hypothetical protein
LIDGRQSLMADNGHQFRRPKRRRVQKTINHQSKAK